MITAETMAMVLTLGAWIGAVSVVTVSLVLWWIRQAAPGKHRPGGPKVFQSHRIADTGWTPELDTTSIRLNDLYTYMATGKQG